jgi:hypothetical protein
VLESSCQGTLVTITPGSNSSQPLSRKALWLCSRFSHHRPYGIERVAEVVVFPRRRHEIREVSGVRSHVYERVQQLAQPRISMRPLTHPPSPPVKTQTALTMLQQLHRADNLPHVVNPQRPAPMGSSTASTI